MDPGLIPDRGTVVNRSGLKTVYVHKRDYVHPKKVYVHTADHLSGGSWAWGRRRVERLAWGGVTCHRRPGKSPLAGQRSWTGRIRRHRMVAEGCSDGRRTHGGEDAVGWKLAGWEAEGRTSSLLLGPTGAGWAAAVGLARTDPGGG